MVAEFAQDRLVETAAEVRSAHGASSHSLAASTILPSALLTHSGWWRRLVTCELRRGEDSSCRNTLLSFSQSV